MSDQSEIGTPLIQLDDRAMRVMLADDHASFRQSLAFMLNREADIRVVLQTATIAETVAAADDPATPPLDIAAIDLTFPDGDGVDGIRGLSNLRRERGQLRIVVLTAISDRLHIARAIEAGAIAWIHKSASIERVVDLFRRIHRGEPALDAAETIALLRLAAARRENDRVDHAALATLTPRERDVLVHLGFGLSDREIADRLMVSNETVRTHTVNLFRKLNVRNRQQALIFAIRAGVVDVHRAAFTSRISHK